MQGDREHPYERCDWGWLTGARARPCHEPAELLLFGQHGPVTYLVALCSKHWKFRRARVRRIVFLAFEDRWFAGEESAAPAADSLAAEAG